ncbi:MAG: chromate resistance protein ChrB domain-containing protein [Microgenomates group bacterium]|jgi:hypothetical protein
MKTIVTHISVDLDAAASVWLIKKYLPQWIDAELKFVPAGTTLDNLQPDINPDIIHVDTGLGQFDHHHIEDRNLCAAKLVLSFLYSTHHISDKDYEALERMMKFVILDDNFADVYLPNPDDDVYDFGLHRIVDGLKRSLKEDVERCDVIFKMLDACLMVFKMKIRAEDEITKGYSFTSKYGKSLALDSENESVIKLALKKGYEFVLLFYSNDNTYRIKTLPSKKYNLSPLYEAIKKQDGKATWFLHISKNMLLNGSSKRPDSVPSSLPLKSVIEIIKNLT